ncbi:MAG: hypothetical protein QOG15_3564 [Solirubrobacteraceae bacterium]|jgi:hypothetical protein|nr:hypothetical protein [Solirubrobacteraceae bacterium]
MPLRRRDKVAFVFRLRRALVLLPVLGATVAMAAVAQSQAPAGDYGGGAIIPPPDSIFDAGNVSIGLHTTSDGKVQVLGYMGAKCQTAFIRASATRRADGSFSVAGTAHATTPAASLITKYEISGTVAGAEAHGTAKATTKVKSSGGTTRECDSGSHDWQARRPGGAIGTPGPGTAGAQLYGTTSQRIGKTHQPIVLRLSADGTKLRRVLYTLNNRCSQATLHERGVIDRNVKIAGNGKVSNVLKTTQKTTGGVRSRSVQRFSGKVGSEGAAGKLSVKSNFINASGHTFASCSTGTVTWKAAP